MSRMNNLDRTLKIISRANGWDPDAIIGSRYSYPEDRVTAGDYMSPEGLANRESEREGGTSKGSMPGEMPSRTNGRTTNANPNPGKPGAGG